MSKNKYLLILALAASLCAPRSYAAEQWKAPHSNYYTTSQQQQFPRFQAPPAAGSKEDIADLDALHAWQEKRTDKQCAEAKAQAYAEYDDFYGDMGLFPRPLPAPALAVFKRIKTETDSIVSKLKDRFQKPRPFARDSSLSPCAGRIGGLAYPSGHAAIARIYALVLSDMIPERRAEIMARADEAALYRVIGGVHYPSDIEAGKRLADAVYPLYLKSAAFRKDIDVLRGCLLHKGAPALQTPSGRSSAN